MILYFFCVFGFSFTSPVEGSRGSAPWTARGSALRKSWISSPAFGVQRTGFPFLSQPVTRISSPRGQMEALDWDTGIQKKKSHA